MQTAFHEFVTLWVVIDPIGTVPVFIAVTASLAAADRKRVALQATLFSAGVLLFFLVFGQLLIDALGIGLKSFQVAGGIILFLFALSMIFGDSKPEMDERAADPEIGGPPSKSNPAVFPLAVPSIASPGAMLAIVLLTDNHRYSIAEQALTGLVMMAVLAVAFVCMLLAGPIIRLIGTAGAAIVSRVMGMILASVAANNVLAAMLDIISTGEL